MPVLNNVDRYMAARYRVELMKRVIETRKPEDSRALVMHAGQKRRIKPAGDV